METIADKSKTEGSYQLNLLEAMKLYVQMGQQKAIEKIAKEYYYDKYRNEYESLIQAFPQSDQADFRGYMENRSQKSRHKYVMVTVNPLNDTRFEYFYKRIHKALRKCWIQASVTCIEWTAPESFKGGQFYNGGLHMHTRLELVDGKDPYQVKREFYNTFKSICGPAGIKVNYSNREDSFLKYIYGSEKKKGSPDFLPKECNDITNLYRSHYKVPKTF